MYLHAMWQIILGSIGNIIGSTYVSVEREGEATPRVMIQWYNLKFGPTRFQVTRYIHDPVRMQYVLYASGYDQCGF